MLGKLFEQKTYLTISHGKVVLGTGYNKNYYSYIEGCIEGIYTRTSHFGGEEVIRWYIDIRDEGELYSLCLPYSSGTFKSIVLSLASQEDLSARTPIRIEPFVGRNGYTKVAVYSEGVKLDWITKQIPSRELVTIQGVQIKDDTKQMEYVCSLCKTINERLEKNTEY